jgi:hypothetical protein
VQRRLLRRLNNLIVEAGRITTIGSRAWTKIGRNQ